MDGIIATFKHGAWMAHVIDRNVPPRSHAVAQSIRYMVRLDSPNGVNTSWPIQYDNGSIAYEFDPPRDAMRAVEAAFQFKHDYPNAPR